MHFIYLFFYCEAGKVIFRNEGQGTEEWNF